METEKEDRREEREDGIFFKKEERTVFGGGDSNESLEKVWRRWFKRLRRSLGRGPGGCRAAGFEVGLVFRGGVGGATVQKWIFKMMWRK